jgi:2-methylcitrate dehydratase PrpD
VGSLGSRDVASALAELRADEIDAPVREQAKVALLHYVGCAARARSQPVVTAARAALDPGPRDDAGQAGSTSGGARRAARALVDGIASHATMQEDIHVASQTHIGPVVFSAAFAVADEGGVSGARLLEGIMGGFEVMGVIGTHLATAGLSRRFRPTGVCGPLGAWAAVSRCLDLDLDRSAHALALAANGGAGLNTWARQGGEEVFLHAGLAAHAGVVGVELARRGMRGSRDILGGEHGFLSVYGCPDPAVVIEDVVTSLRAPTALAGIKLKPYPGCNYVQTVVEACEQVRPSVPAPGDAAEVVVRLTTAAATYPGCDHPGPWSTRLEAQMSVQFAAAATLLDGDYARSIREFDVDRGARYEALARRTRLAADARLDARYPGQQGVEVAVGTGNPHQLDDFSGLGSAEVRVRLEEVADAVGAADAAAEIVGLFDQLEGLADVVALVRAARRLWERAAPPG